MLMRDRTDDRTKQADEARRAVALLIDRVVHDARPPNRRVREELRRELESHFAEAADSPEALCRALERFGDPALVSDVYRQAYGRRHALFYALKVITAICASTFVAFLLQVMINLRFALAAETRRLAPGHIIAAFCSIVVVLGAVTAWELGIQPLCARLEHRPLRLLTTLATLFGGIILTHATTKTFIGPRDAFVGSALLVAVWTLTIAIQSRLDLAFLDFVQRRSR
jgi:hypothetical protein